MRLLKSLLSLSKEEIKNNHQDLKDNWVKKGFRSFLNLLSEKEGWWIVLFLLLIFFVIGNIIDFDFLKVITLDRETSVLLADQRTINIAAIFSITLIVAGFLINNIAVKSPVTYKLLFKESYLFPTIYMTLITIAIFIIISTLRNTEFEFFNLTRFVLAGTYLSFLILFMIGYLFRTIILFTNDGEIASMIKKQFIQEAKLKMRSALTAKYSRNIFIRELEKAGANQYDFSQILATAEKIDAMVLSDKEVKNIDKQTVIVTDVNLFFLKFLVWFNTKIRNERVYFQPLQIGEPTDRREDYIWCDSRDNEYWEKLYLKFFLDWKRDKSDFTEKSIYESYFEEKLEELSKKGDYRNLEKVLDSYVDIYNFQMTNQ
jgi:hypothetical protein